MGAVLFAADHGARHFDRHGPDPGLETEAREVLHHLAIEIGHGPGNEADLPLLPGVGLDGQLVIDEVEADLERPRSVWNRRRGQPARGHVERHLPRVIERRGPGEADLAHDLGHHVERGIGVLPSLVGQGRPDRTAGGGHGRSGRHVTLLVASAASGGGFPGGPPGTPAGQRCERERDEDERREIDEHDLEALIGEEEERLHRDHQQGGEIVRRKGEMSAPAKQRSTCDERCKEEDRIQPVARAAQREPEGMSDLRETIEDGGARGARARCASPALGESRRARSRLRPAAPGGRSGS